VCGLTTSKQYAERGGGRSGGALWEHRFTVGKNTAGGGSSGAPVHYGHTEKPCENLPDAKDSR